MLDMVGGLLFRESLTGYGLPSMAIVLGRDLGGGVSRDCCSCFPGLGLPIDTMRGMIDARASEAGMREAACFVEVYGMFIRFVFCALEGLRGMFGFRVWSNDASVARFFEVMAGMGMMIGVFNELGLIRQ
jgi:hypothetical protein